MATVPFPDFLAWSRVFIADHGREAWRLTWSQRPSRARIGTCSRSSCNESVIFVSGRAPNGDDHQGCDHCDRCQDHCECYFCGACGEVSEGSCAHCDNGECCCECVICTGCGRECSDNYCSACSDNGNSRTCDRCCEGHPDDDDESSDRNIELFTSPLTFHAPKLHERKINASKRFLSVEIEVAKIDSGSDTARAVRKWRGGIVEDGSLPNSGFEINTAPAGGDKFVEQITEICAALARGEASVTAACGLHVHIDARDFDHYMIRRLVNVYALVEDALFGMASPSRRTSSYCAPCGKAYRESIKTGAVPYKVAKAATLEAVYAFKPDPDADASSCKYEGRRLHSRKKNKYESARYNALNLHSWFYRGTVECRIFNGSTNRDKIVHWGMLWARILDYVARKSDKEVATELSASPLNNLLHIAQLPVLADFIRERTAKFAKEET